MLFFGILAAIETYYISINLPQQAVTHFDMHGNPNGWMSPKIFFWFMIAMIALITASFTLMPVGWMNIPNRSHWLSTQHREETERYISKNYTAMGIATMSLIMYADWIVYAANIADAPRLDKSFLAVVIAYLIYSILWGVRFFTRFSKVQ